MKGYSNQSERMQKPNIIFILMDACRRDHLGCYGYDKPTSPNIDKLAKESIIFENAFSVGNSTNPCLTSIFSGRSILSHGMIRHMGTEQKEIDEFNKKKIKLLPEILKENGYTTMAFDWLGRWQKRGYDYYEGIGDHKFKISLFNIQLPYETADIIFKKAMKKIKQNKDKPFFAFLHCWDTHSPYSPPKKFIKRFREYKYTSLKKSDIPLETGTTWIHILAKDANDVFARYDGAINFVDSQISRLIGFLKRRGLYDNTIIVVTADHGENLIDHGIYFGHHGVYDTTLRIPFIMKVPGVEAKRIGSLFQQPDFVPTLLKQIGIKCPEVDGRPLDLKDPAEDAKDGMFFIANEGSIVAFRDKNYKYIYEPMAGIEEVYDLKKDPSEVKNLAGNHEIRSRLRKKAEDVIMKAKEARSGIYDEKKIRFNKLHYSVLSRRVEFLERDLEKKNKEMELLVGSRIFKALKRTEILLQKLGIGSALLRVMGGKKKKRMK